MKIVRKWKDDQGKELRNRERKPLMMSGADAALSSLSVQLVGNLFIFLVSQGIDDFGNGMINMFDCRRIWINLQTMQKMQKMMNFLMMHNLQVH